MSNLTRLEAFIQGNGIRPSHLAREAGISRKHLLWLRMGRSEPRRPTMVQISAGCSHLLRRNVEVAELFVVGD